jgi:photosystem II stability/assembly factor-like uncharacterized protein
VKRRKGSDQTTRTTQPRSSAPASTRRGPWARRIVVSGLLAATVAILAVAVLRSSGGAGTPVAWTRFGTQDVHSLAFSDSTGDAILFGHHGGILRTQDGGRSWEPLPFSQDAMGLTAAADGSLIVAGHLVFQQSTDGGATWSPIDADLPSLDIHAFARSPTDSSRMWAYLAGGGVYESTDGGATWVRVYEGHVLSLLALESQQEGELIGVEPFFGVVRSSDGGRTWLPVSEPPAAPVTSLAGTGDGRVLLVGAPGGLHRSDDGGVSWRQVLRSDTVLAAAVLGDGSTIAAVDQQTRFYRSDDGGRTWPGP